MKKVTMTFPNNATRDTFMSWLSDAGGEQDFMQLSNMHDTEPINNFDYSKAFVAWGYDPKKHGAPVIECKHINED